MVKPFRIVNSKYAGICSVTRTLIIAPRSLPLRVTGHFATIPLRRSLKSAFRGGGDHLVEVRLSDGVCFDVSRVLWINRPVLHGDTTRELPGRYFLAELVEYQITVQPFSGRGSPTLASLPGGYRYKRSFTIEGEWTQITPELHIPRRPLPLRRALLRQENH